MSKVINMTGQKIGYLTVLKRAENTNKGQAQWQCQCDCGNVVTVLGQCLRNGKVKSCGCYSRNIGKSNFIDITGKRFGKLVVMKFIGKDDNNHSLWQCQCDCGSIVVVPKSNLVTGGTKSCGCLKTSGGEYQIEIILSQYNIKYIKEFTFSDLKGEKNYPLRFDFYLPDYNLLIEYDGIQHTQNIPFFNSSLIQKNDKLKNEYCEQHNLPLLRISYLDFLNIEEILKENLKIT